jgi:hypothetical protein
MSRNQHKGYCCISSKIRQKINGHRYPTASEDGKGFEADLNFQMNPELLSRLNSNLFLNNAKL